MSTPAIWSGERQPNDQLQYQIRDSLRKRHLEWIDPNRDCSACESDESRLAGLLTFSNRPSASRRRDPKETLFGNPTENYDPPADTSDSPFLYI
jgi:hypothetical protein